MVIIFSNIHGDKYICYFTLLSVAITCVGEDRNKLELSYTANGNVK